MKATIFEKLIRSRKSRLNRLKNKVIEYLNSRPSLSSEESSILEYLKGHPINVFPYTFIEKYSEDSIKLELDTVKNLLFTRLDGKKLYYKNKVARKARRYFKDLLLEQDAESPHRYQSNTFDVDDNDVVLDVGAADGNFSLSVVERVKHIYIFEPDPDWNRALAATFEPWKEKVTIVSKLVSDITEPLLNKVSLNDHMHKDTKVNFIKSDVEGYELKLLKGANKILQSSDKLKIAICTYHGQDDGDNIFNYLSERGFNCEFTPGYMLYYYGKENIIKEPYLRRAVLRAVKK